MRISIDQHIYEYIPDFNPHNPSENRWRKQNQDSFKFIELGGNKIFVKRFDKDREYISGYDFLQKIKGQKIAGLPRIYDFVSQLENGFQVYYLFQEVLEGDILENVIHHSVLHFNPLSFALQLYDTLNTIVLQGFWHTDFVEKNIFITKDNKVYLIDLDSVASVKKILPRDKLMSNDVNNNYKGSVCKDWYVDTYHYEASEVLKKIKGDTVNFLELVILMGQFRYYINSSEKIDFLDTKTRKSVPDFLKRMDYKFTEAIFKSSFEPKSNHQKAINKTLFTAFVQKLFPGKGSVFIDFKKYSIIGSTTIKNEAQQKKTEILLNQAKQDLEKLHFQEAICRVQEILVIDPQSYYAKQFLETIYQREKKYRLMIDSKKALYDKNFALAKQKANKVLLIDPYHSSAKTLLDQIIEEEKSTVNRIKYLSQTISSLEKNKYLNFWLFRIFIHSFLGFGLLGITPSIRKWFYPSVNLVMILILRNYEDDYLPAIIILLGVIFLGYIDVIVTSLKSTKQINLTLRPLKLEKNTLLNIKL